MLWLIDLALNNTRAVTVAMLAIVAVGVLCLGLINIDILPVYDKPAVQVITFYNGMGRTTSLKPSPTAWNAGLANPPASSPRNRAHSRRSIIRNYYDESIDPNGALTQVNSLASAAIPNLPPGTLPPVILNFDPTGTIPVCIIALDSKTAGESALYDVGRYEVRNMIMSSPRAVAPVVYGGKVRAIMAYLDPIKLQARSLSPVDVMDALDQYNIFLPTGDAKFGTIDYVIDSNSMYGRPKTWWTSPSA